MGLNKFLISVLMIGLFSIAILTFALNFGSDNQAGVLLSDDDDYVTLNDQLKGNATQFRLDVNTSTDALVDSSLESGDEVTRTGGQFKVGMGTMMSMTYSVLKNSWKKIFGSDNNFEIILVSLISILGLIFINYIIKAWWGKNPD